MFATAKFGETVQVPVYIAKAAGAAASGSVTLNATSESDPSKSMSVTCGTDGTVGGTVPATLSLTLGTPASFGPFTPGAQKDYFATTAANVISTAGDAALSVADPAPPTPAIWSTARSCCPSACRPTPSAARRPAASTRRSAAPRHRHRS